MGVIIPWATQSAAVAALNDKAGAGGFAAEAYSRRRSG